METVKKKYILSEPIYMLQQYTYTFSIYSISVSSHTLFEALYLYFTLCIHPSTDRTFQFS